MKLKVNWKELGKQLWEAVKPIFLAAIGGGIVTVAAAAVRRIKAAIGNRE